MTPGAFWRMTALARASTGTVATVVTSPPPTSSARARATTSAEIGVSASMPAEDRTRSFYTGCSDLVIVGRDHDLRGIRLRRIGSRAGMGAAVTLLTLIS